jgi:hypothetical protein
VPKDSAPCSVLLNSTIKSRITDDSWIDLSGTRHFSLLPNLSYFVGVVPVLPVGGLFANHAAAAGTASETQVATMLNLAARSGNSTGKALANNRVMLGVPDDGANALFLRDRDVWRERLSIRKAFNQRLLADSPYQPVDNLLSVREPALWTKIQRRLSGDWASDGVDADRYFSSSSAWRGLLAIARRGTRSGWCVAMASSDDQLAKLEDDLNSPRINAGIRGDTAVITSDNGVRSFQVSTPFPAARCRGT